MMSVNDQLIHARDLAHVASELYLKAAKLRKGEARTQMEQVAKKMLATADAFTVMPKERED